MATFDLHADPDYKTVESTADGYSNILEITFTTYRGVVTLKRDIGDGDLMDAFREFHRMVESQDEPDQLDLDLGDFDV